MQGMGLSIKFTTLVEVRYLGKSELNKYHIFFISFNCLFEQNTLLNGVELRQKGQLKWN